MAGNLTGFQQNSPPANMALDTRETWSLAFFWVTEKFDSNGFVSQSIFTQQCHGSIDTIARGAVFVE